MTARFWYGSQVPPPARLAGEALRRQDYVDSFSLPLPPSAPPLDELLVHTLSDLPGWVWFLLALRDRIVGVLGLRKGGDALPGHSELPLRAGGRVGFFSVAARRSSGDCDEILLAADDRHLEVCVSALCARDADGELRFAMTTIVEFHNLLGRLYFVPVRPFHRLILMDMIRRLARWLERESVRKGT